MGEHDEVTYDRLLKIWQFRREIFNRYSRALQMLMADKKVDWQRQRELRERLTQAEQALHEVSERLKPYEVAAA